jgi:hypothetical protein
MAIGIDQTEADDREELVQRVAALDIAKGSAKVCVRVPHETVERRRVTKVFDVASTTKAIMGLAEELSEARVERVVMEATSDYWRPFFYVLEARGLVVWLVNARDVKQVPGRPKTDKLDAVWLAKLNERGMLRQSFVPLRKSVSCGTSPGFASTSPMTDQGMSSASRSSSKTPRSSSHAWRATSWACLDVR